MPRPHGMARAAQPRHGPLPVVEPPWGPPAPARQLGRGHHSYAQPGWTPP